MTPGPAVILSALAPVISHVPLVEFIAPAPSVTHVTPNEQFSPLSQEKVDVVQIDFVHPAGSMTVVEPSVSHVVGSLLLLDEFATPVHQEQIASERFVHLPMPQNLEQIVEGVIEIPQERFPERTEKRLFDFPIPPTGEDAVVSSALRMSAVAPLLLWRFLLHRSMTESGGDRVRNACSSRKIC